jgi:hypothetical protein
MYKNTKTIMNDIVDSLTKNKCNAENVITLMKYPENIKYFEGKAIGIELAIKLIKDIMSTFPEEGENLS